MTVHEQRLQKLRAHLRDAHDELHALPLEERKGSERLEEVIEHAGVMLEGAEPALVSTRAFSALESASCTISNSPRAALREADGCADALLDAVAMLPGRGRDESTPAGLEEAIAKQRHAHDEQIARLRNELAESKRQSAAASKAELDELRSELAQERSAALAGAAELYRDQARRQRRAAEIFRGSTILTALAAVAVAVSATLWTEPTFESLVGDLFASLLLAGLAAYLAFQSERHRSREVDANAVYLELVAFSPPGSASREGRVALGDVLQPARPSHARQNGHVLT